MTPQWSLWRNWIHQRKKGPLGHKHNTTNSHDCFWTTGDLWPFQACIMTTRCFAHHDDSFLLSKRRFLVLVLLMSVWSQPARWSSLIKSSREGRPDQQFCRFQPLVFHPLTSVSRRFSQLQVTKLQPLSSAAWFYLRSITWCSDLTFRVSRGTLVDNTFSCDLNLHIQTHCVSFEWNKAKMLFCVRLQQDDYTLT